MKKKRILVDLSFTIPHHGHIRILQKASKLGKVNESIDKNIYNY